MTSTPAVNRSKTFYAGLLMALSALVVLLALAVAPDANAAHGRPIRVGPKGDAFYKAPNRLPKGHGKVIWARQAQNLIDAEGDDATSTKLLYTSKSPQRKRIAVSGSVAVPNGKAPKGGWPVITWDHGTTGLADSCAPSTFEDGTAFEPFIDEWLKMGYAVVRTDYQGLGTPGPHPYLIGKSAARSALDIIAAARQFEPLSKDYVIAGHSQGGHAALWTASYADSWQPNLRLHGTMAFAPASHIAEQIDLLPALTAPNGLSALAVSILAGASTANPRIDADKLLNPEPLALYPDVETKCLGELAGPDSLGGIAPSELLQDGANLNPLVRVLNKNNPDITTPAPIIVLQGTADTTVFPTYTDLLVDELTDTGDDVNYVKVPGANHGSIMVSGQPAATGFLDANLPAG